MVSLWYARQGRKRPLEKSESEEEVVAEVMSCALVWEGGSLCWLVALLPWLFERPRKPFHQENTADEASTSRPAHASTKA